MKIVILALIGGAAVLPLAAVAMAPHAGGGAMGAMAGPGAMSAPRASFTAPHAPTTLRGPSHTGQPNQSCGSASAPNTPGNAASAPGSAFNPSGQAGSVYAGQQPQNSRNTASVSQYDVACSHQPM